MDTMTLNAIRNEPGSIGDTARAYATSFARMVTKRTDEPIEFKNAFHLTLLYRAVAAERIKPTHDNLLLPLHLKGIDELLRLFDMQEPFWDLPFKIDLPTMIFFSMLMESENYRLAFAEMSTDDVKQVISVIREEVYKVCPYQCVVTELAFQIEIAVRYKNFLVQIDENLKPIILNRILSKGG